jgi:hypothetical protein
MADFHAPVCRSALPHKNLPRSVASLVYSPLGSWMLQLNLKGVRYPGHVGEPDTEGQEDEGGEASDAHLSHAVCQNTGAIATNVAFLRYHQKLGALAQKNRSGNDAGVS